MIQGRVDRKEGGRETERGQWGGGDWDGEMGETEMGRWGGGGEGGEELARARSGKESARQEGGQEGVGWGGGDRIGTIGRRLGGGNGEGKMERGQREGGDGRGAKGMGRRRGKRRRHFTDGYDSSTWNAWVE